MPRLTETKKQLTKFIFIGGLAVLTDLACYYAFLQALPDALFPPPLNNEAVAKTLSFLCGLSVTYQLNKRWTWRRKDRSNRRLVKFLGLYGVSLVLNVSMNSLVPVDPPSVWDLELGAPQVPGGLRGRYGHLRGVQLRGPEVLDLQGCTAGGGERGGGRGLNAGCVV
jgi:putative flippase GtrA